MPNELDPVRRPYPPDNMRGRYRAEPYLYYPPLTENAITNGRSW